MWSVMDPDSAAATSIKYVVREEMLHAALAANLLTAVGGKPRFTGAAVPRYPEPMRHHDPRLPLVLHLAPASMDLLRDVFLRIEQPEEPRRGRRQTATRRSPSSTRRSSSRSRVWGTRCSRVIHARR